MEIKGVIHDILDTETFPSGFTKRVIVINTGGDYPQLIPIEFFKDKCDILDKYSNNQSVSVGINIRGREHEGKYYSSIQGWKIEGVTQQPTASEAPQADNKGFSDEQDDLPF